MAAAIRYNHTVGRNPAPGEVGSFIPLFTRFYIPNGGARIYIPKWMVYFMENPIKMYDVGLKKTNYFWKHPYGNE